MSPKSDKNGNSNGPSTGHPSGSDINVKEFELTKELFDKGMSLDNSSFDANKIDCEGHAPFDSSGYPNGANTSLYTKPPSSRPTNPTHDRKYQKKKGSHSCRTKPDKLKLISPLPNFRLHSIHYSVKYD